MVSFSSQTSIALKKTHIVHWLLLVKLINTTFQMLLIGHLQWKGHYHELCL